MTTRTKRKPNEVTLGGVKFGRAIVGGRKEMTFNLRNGTERSFIITAIKTSDPFHLGNRIEFPLLLEPDEICPIGISFEPHDSVVYSSEVDVFMDDAVIQKISVEGQGSLTAPTPSPSKRESSFQEDHAISMCLEAIHALEAYAKIIEKKVEEISSSHHVSWDPALATTMTPSAKNQRSSQIRSFAPTNPLDDVLERLSKLESMYGLISSKLGIVEQDATTDVIPSTPMPTKLTPEDAQLLEDMGAGPGAEAKPTGKTPARWRDFVTGAAALYEEPTPARSLFSGNVTPIDHTPMGKRSRSPVDHF